MPKVSKTLEAQVQLNPEKGGGWLANVNIYHYDEGEKTYLVKTVTAWKNASAAKRWVKAKVQELTPRKSVKMTAFLFDAVEKPTAFAGELTYKEQEREMSEDLFDEDLFDEDFECDECGESLELCECEDEEIE